MTHRTRLIVLAILATFSLAACQALGMKQDASSDSEPAVATEATAAAPAAEEAATQASEPIAAPEAKLGAQVLPTSKVKNHLNVREHPDSGSAIVGKLSPDESAPLVGEAPGWFQITLNDGTTGFVSQDWAQTTEVPETAAAPAETAAEPAVEPPAATASLDPATMTEGVYFVKPHDGDVLEGPVIMVGMGVKGKDLRPAGEIVPGTGHHHLIIDSEIVERGKLVPSQMEIMHFGGAETEVPVKLTKGQHKLTLQFANGHHISYGKKWSRVIHITVK